MFRRQVRCKTANGDEYYVWKTKWLNVFLAAGLAYAVIRFIF